MAKVVRFLRYYDRLKPLIERRLPKLSTVENSFAECVVELIARQLMPDEIAEVRRFLATPAGGKFWSASGVTVSRLNGCYAAALELRVTDADYRAVGFTAPPSPKPPLPGTIYSWPKPVDRKCPAFAHDRTSPKQHRLRGKRTGHHFTITE